MSAALELYGVTKRYRAGAHRCFAHAEVLRGVDLRVLEGESVAVVGGPGAGKSTVLFLAAGLLMPDGGVVRWFGDERRTVAAERTSYFFGGARSVSASRRTERRRPHLQLIDAPESLPGETLSRLARWIDRRRARGDAVLIATRVVSLAGDLAERVVTLREGRASAFGVPSRAARVAERPAMSHSAVADETNVG